MARRSPQSDKFLTVPEVAAMLGVREGTIYNGDCGTDELLRIKIGRRLVFSYEDVQQWIIKRIRAARDERREQKRKGEEKARHNAEIKQILRLASDNTRRPK